MPKVTQLVSDMLGYEQGKQIRGQLGLEVGEGATQSLLVSFPERLQSISVGPKVWGTVSCRMEGPQQGRGSRHWGAESQEGTSPGPSSTPCFRQATHIPQDQWMFMPFSK